MSDNDGMEIFTSSSIMNKYSDKQWEELCDGCGQCCMNILEDEETGEFLKTSVACEFLDLEKCRCKIYMKRFEKAQTCTKITQKNIYSLKWLPETCAYRRVSEKKKLPEWHHLITGNREDVHNYNISVKNRAVSGENIHPDDLENFII